MRMIYITATIVPSTIVGAKIPRIQPPAFTGGCMTTIYKERRLKKWQKIYETWYCKQWKLENLYLPDMHKFKAYGKQEWRN